MEPLVLLRNCNVTSDVWAEARSFAGDSEVGFVIVLLSNATMSVRLEWSNDLTNWSVAQTWLSVGFGLNALSPVTGLAAGYIRLRLSPDDLPASLIVATVSLLLYPSPNVAFGESPAPPAPRGAQ